MILQALYRYYEILLQDPNSDIAPPGYSNTGVSFALNLSAQGKLQEIYPLFEKVEMGKKVVERPRRMRVPEQVKRAGITPTPNFLCDNAVFVLGIADHEKESKDAQYADKRFTAFRQFNLELLAKAHSTAARAVESFLNQHNLKTARDNPEIARYIDRLMEGGNLVFQVEGRNLLDDAEICRVWEEYRSGKEAVWGQCLVTGEMAPIARLHPSLRGIRNTNSTGASLVSFNDRAYESYNKEKLQGLNSPVSEKAAFAYGTALNYLLSSANPHRKFLLGDTTVVYWAESKNPQYANAYASVFAPEYQEEVPDEQAARRDAEERLGQAAVKVRQARALDLEQLTAGLDPNTRFYVLGLAPNVARVSVRFFISEPFGRIVERIMRHYTDLAIEKEFPNQPTYLSIEQILSETVSKKAKDQEPAPLLAGAVIRAVLSGTPYPESLFTAILTRIRADMDDTQARIKKINYTRAAVIKACLARKYLNQPSHPIKEVLQMSLNEKSTHPAYLLGRLFAVLEKAQQEAIGDVNAGIKDRYFASACASPSTVFPMLLRLSQHHISKAEHGYVNDRRIQDILDKLDIENNPIPTRLTLDQQGVFILGYYHQRTNFYVPRAEK